MTLMWPLKPDLGQCGLLAVLPCCPGFKDVTVKFSDQEFGDDCDAIIKTSFFKGTHYFRTRRIFG